MGRYISEGILSYHSRGAMTGDGVNSVLHMLYADGLSLTTNDPGKIQVLLNGLRACAMRKGLTVNTSKSGVVHLIDKSCSSLPTSMYRNVGLPKKDQFRYLDRLVDKQMNLQLEVADWRSWAYTDGSCQVQNGKTVIGA
eukprot:1143107-Pelagomonas_calceolata.AAC.1